MLPRAAHSVTESGPFRKLSAQSDRERLTESGSFSRYRERRFLKAQSCRERRFLKASIIGNITARPGRSSLFSPRLVPLSSLRSSETSPSRAHMRACAHYRSWAPRPAAEAAPAGRSSPPPRNPVRRRRPPPAGPPALQTPPPSATRPAAHPPHPHPPHRSCRPRTAAGCFGKRTLLPVGGGGGRGGGGGWEISAWPGLRCDAHRGDGAHHIDDMPTMLTKARAAMTAFAPPSHYTPASVLFVPSFLRARPAARPRV